MEVVVSTTYGRFAVESDLDNLTIILAKVNLNLLAFIRIANFIERQTGVSAPCTLSYLLSVCKNKHNELVIILLTRNHLSRIGSGFLGQRQVESQLISCLHGDSRADNPGHGRILYIEDHVARRIREYIVRTRFGNDAPTGSHFL